MSNHLAQFKSLAFYTRMRNPPSHCIGCDGELVELSRSRPRGCIWFPFCLLAYRWQWARSYPTDLSVLALHDGDLLSGQHCIFGTIGHSEPFPSSHNGNARESSCLFLPGKRLHSQKTAEAHPRFSLFFVLFPKNALLTCPWSPKYQAVERLPIA